MKAYRHLVKYAIFCGYVVSVFDGEEWQVKRSKKLEEICDAIKSVEEAELQIRDAQGNKVAWALVSAYGLADDETVMDYSICSFMEEWEKEYDRITN